MTILANTAGQLLLKRAAMVGGASGGPFYRPFLSVWFILGVACLGFSSVLWVTVLKKLPLTIAHPIMGIVFILVPIVSHALWSEPLPPARIAGIGIVIVGICLVARAE